MKNDLLKRLLVLALIAATWQIFSLRLGSPLLFPTFTDTMRAFVDAIRSDSGMVNYALETLYTLGLGFAWGLVASVVLLSLALSFSFGAVFLETITGLFAPLPAVSIFPLAIMWFGVSLKSVVFLTGFAILFPITVSAFQGFKTVSPTLKNVGRNLGLTGIPFIFRILIPAALPAIISGLRNGITNGFRALIAVELVMGAATGSGGLGWFVMINKQNLEIPTVFAGILMIMITAAIFEVGFKVLEKYTVQRWGMIGQ